MVEDLISGEVNTRSRYRELEELLTKVILNRR